jgi:hypothetical protein
METTKERFIKTIQGTSETACIYLIVKEKDDGEIYRMTRINMGFSSVELLGELEMVQLDILDQMAGKIKPSVEMTRVILECKTNERGGEVI